MTPYDKECIRYIFAKATGNTGKVVAERLLAAGKKVKVIGRSREKLNFLVEKGALPVVGDILDKAFLEDAFKDAEGVYAMIPPKFDAQDFRAYQRGVAESIVGAVSKNRVLAM